MTKMTKREMYDVIATVFAATDREDRDEILTFVEKEKAALDRKNEKAKERAAEKRAAGDALKARIEEILNDEPITVNGIIVALGDEGLTPAKITARTRQLVAEGVALKEQVKMDGRKLMAYTRA